ncbi:hypothetical protein M407DRAFT_24532 [Tulasnella calospora MUT 4182]|uniref:Ubiquitin-like protease family profile domain-containing protein n=1 Tax=Tulasnella calospora MUT 4182 TaxID=1051891 RepID=A0A0C3QHR0_9AGAM|nr:hypothetical protein M407DRAFT_24532 [Tulasnella calospora MUT 4182]
MLHTRDLALLLGPHWLDDEVLNAGCDWIRQQSLGSPSTKSSLILGTHYLTHISNRLADRHIPFHLRKRSVFEQRIAAGSIQSIFIPINIRNIHWTLVKVDCPRSLLAYGDSLNRRATIPPETRALLLRWLADLLPQATFTETSLAVPQQEDGNSCGVIVMTEIAHHCLGLPVFEPKEPQSIRMECFLRLTTCYGESDEGGDSDDGEEEGIPDSQGVDLPQLVLWPTDEDFASAAKLAAIEVQTMMTFLGIDTTRLFDDSAPCPCSVFKPQDGGPPSPSNRTRGKSDDDLQAGDASARIESHGTKQEISFRDVLRTRDELPILTSAEDNELDGIALGIVAVEAEILQRIDALGEPRYDLQHHLHFSLFH